FYIFYIVLFIFYPPKYVISPLTILYVYYGLWFLLAPLFAQRYVGINNELSYSYSFILLSVTFGIGVIFLYDKKDFRHFSDSTISSKNVRIPSKKTLLLLFLISTLFVILIVANSGGIDKWIHSPGDAFLNRSGSGVYVVGSHFSSLALAALCGYHAFVTRQKKILCLFILWLLLTSPVHGSKFQISLLLIMSLLPWLKELRFYSRGTLILGIALLGILFLGLYFRNISWMTWHDLVPYTLNYFDTLDNLALSLKELSPGLNKTFFMPFNKLLTPFGNDGGIIFYDMSQWLTSIYDPDAWKIRATIQFPVETDMYLNFYFYLGIPILMSFFFFIARIYSAAHSKQHLGAWFAAMLMTLFMISHLRGSIYNHTDFYMYPYIAVMFFLFRKYKFPSKRM
ncbi:polymerase, partial [Salmonella enterica subsp. diarizonae]|nr:polymerase [Salmonella enterica subsp. diarizonae]EHA1971849.1 polymerase [Salmonella enterica subsp. diarizonae]